MKVKIKNRWQNYSKRALVYAKFVKKNKLPNNFCYARK